MPTPIVAMNHPEVLRQLFNAPREFRLAPDYGVFLNGQLAAANAFNHRRPPAAERRAYRLRRLPQHQGPRVR